jgi:hypothetical protein
MKQQRVIRKFHQRAARELVKNLSKSIDVPPPSQTPGDQESSGQMALTKFDDDESD